jgi:plasmid rolling circle replication initiator protein Rep
MCRNHTYTHSLKEHSLGIESSGVPVKPDTLLDTVQLTDEKASKRAERKLLTQLQVQNLMQLDSPLHSAYERTYWCSSIIKHQRHTITKQERLITSFCGKRWCTVCGSIKTAEIMANYKQSLEQLSDGYFVTLTVVSVKGDELKSRLKAMNNTFKQIKNLFHKRKIPFDGFRKTECNHNAEAQTFNPHYHLIVNGKKQAKLLVDEWLKRNTGTKVWCQPITKVDKNSYIELFKYQFKAITTGAEFSPQAQDTIYRAFNGIRAFQPFGNVHKSPTNDDVSLEASEYGVESDSTLQGEWETLDIYIHNQYHCNWLNSEGKSVKTVTIRDKIHQMAQAFSSA